MGAVQYRSSGTGPSALVGAGSREPVHKTCPAADGAERDLGSGAFDKYDLALRAAQADGLGSPVFGRVVAILGGLKRRKLDHHVAGTPLALDGIRGPAAHQEAGAMAFECRLGAGEIALVALGIMHIHARDPISFR